MSETPRTDALINNGCHELNHDDWYAPVKLLAAINAMPVEHSYPDYDVVWFYSDLRAAISDAIAALTAQPSAGEAVAVDAGNLADDPLYKSLDALYKRGWTDRNKERDYDPRGTVEWQATLDLFRLYAHPAPSEPVAERKPDGYFYEWDYGSFHYRDFDGGYHNGCKPTRVVPYYTAPTKSPPAASESVVVPREYGVIKRDFIASPDTPQKRGALPTVTVVFPVEDWVARDRFADALLRAASPAAPMTAAGMDEGK